MYILQCPRCGRVREWSREEVPTGPGPCSCHSRQYWRVIKERPQKGFVRVMSIHGTQELKGPHWQEDPSAWMKDT